MVVDASYISASFHQSLDDALLSRLSSICRRRRIVICYGCTSYLSSFGFRDMRWHLLKRVTLMGVHRRLTLAQAPIILTGAAGPGIVAKHKGFLIPASNKQAGFVLQPPRRIFIQGDTVISSSPSFGWLRSPVRATPHEFSAPHHRRSFPCLIKKEVKTSLVFTLRCPTMSTGSDRTSRLLRK